MGDDPFWKVAFWRVRKNKIPKNNFRKRVTLHLDASSRELSNGGLGSFVTLSDFSQIDFLCSCTGRPIQLYVLSSLYRDLKRIEEVYSRKLLVSLLITIQRNWKYSPPCKVSCLAILVHSENNLHAHNVYQSELEQRQHLLGSLQQILKGSN